MIQNRFIITAANFIAVGCMGMSMGFLGPGLPALQEGLKIDLASAGLFTSAIQFGYGLMGTVGGILSDLYRGERVLAAGCGFLGGSALLFGLWNSFSLNLLLVILMGIGCGLILASSHTVRPRLPWRGLAIAAGLALLAAVAALVFTSVPLQVEIKPGADRVAFEGGLPVLRLGTSHLLRPGTYQLVAEREGYATLRVPVTVTEARGQRLSYALAPLPGRLEIVLPVPGTARIDGREAGPAPGVFELPAGQHTVVIDTERYLDFTAEVQVEGLGRVQKLVPKLVPAWAPVSMTSEPAGAEVIVAGKTIARTPARFELMAGSHRVELRHDGFKSWVSDLQVEANTPLEIGTVQLGLPDGRLVVRSTPAGASVAVGGAYRGRTPLEIDVRPDIAQDVPFHSTGLFSDECDHLRTS